MVTSRRQKTVHRANRAIRTRWNIRQNSRRPRLCVFRSLTNIYCQIVDDDQGRTLASASSRDKGLRDQVQGMRKTDVAVRVGTELAERAKAAGVTKVVFDRGYYKFHGRIKALADAARAAGLEF